MITNMIQKTGRALAVALAFVSFTAWAKYADFANDAMSVASGFSGGSVSGWTMTVTDATKLQYVDRTTPDSLNRQSRGWYAGATIQWPQNGATDGRAEMKTTRMTSTTSGENPGTGNGLTVTTYTPTAISDTKMDTTTWWSWITPEEAYAAKGGDFKISLHMRATNQGLTYGVNDADFYITIPTADLTLKDDAGVQWFPVVATNGTTGKVYGDLDVALDAGGEVVVVADTTITNQHTLGNGVIFRKSGKTVGGLDKLTLNGGSYDFDPDAAGCTLGTGCTVELNGSTQLYDVKPHTHNWTFSKDGDTVTATCSAGSGCAFSPQKLTIKINETSKMYDGTTLTTSLIYNTSEAEFKEQTGATVGSVYWAGRSDGKNDGMSAGEQNAQVQVRDTVHDKYYRPKASLTIDPAPMSSATVALTAAEMNFTGIEQTNEVASVTAAEISASDWEVVDKTALYQTGSGYSNETYTVTLKGKGNFTGTKDVTWTIKAPTRVPGDMGRGDFETGGKLYNDNYGECDQTTKTLPVRWSTNIIFYAGHWFVGMTVDLPTDIRIFSPSDSKLTEDKDLRVMVSTVPGRVFTGSEIYAGTVTETLFQVLDEDHAQQWWASIGTHQYFKKIRWFTEVSPAMVEQAKLDGKTELTFTLTVGGITYKPYDGATWEGLKYTDYTIKVPVEGFTFLVGRNEFRTADVDDVAFDTTRLRMQSDSVVTNAQKIAEYNIFTEEEWYGIVETNISETCWEYSMVRLEPAAKIGAATYVKLVRAYEAAKDGDTIELLKDVNESLTNIAKSITLDLGGFTLTGADTSSANNVLAVAPYDFTGTFRLRNGKLGRGNLDFKSMAGTVSIEDVDIGDAAIRTWTTGGQVAVDVSTGVKSGSKWAFPADPARLTISGIGSLFKYNQKKFAGEGLTLAHNTNAATRAYTYIVVPTNTAGLVQLVKNGVGTDEYFLSGSDAMGFVGTEKGDTLKLVNGSYPADGFLFTDADLMKCLRFDLNGAETNQTKFVAVRHAELYAAKPDSKSDKLVFTRKDPVTRRLTFVVDGCGTAKVGDWPDGELKPVAHNQTGTESVMDYAEVTGGELYELAGIPLPNAGHECVGWYTNTFEGTTVAEVLADPTKGKWVAMTFDEQTTFAMPDFFDNLEDTTKKDDGYVVKVVFAPPSKRSKLTVVVEPAGAAKTLWLDDKALVSEDGGTTYVTNNVKKDAAIGHLLNLVPYSTTFTNVEWIVKGQSTVANPYAGLPVTEDDLVITAKVMTAAQLVVDGVLRGKKPYDGQPTNVVASVKNWLDAKCAYHFEYSENGTSWSENNPQKTNKGVYRVFVRLVDAYGVIHADEFTLITIDPVNAANGTPTWETPFDYVYDGMAKTPAITKVTVPNGGELWPDLDFTTTYECNTNAGVNTAKAKVSFKRNAKGSATYTFTIAPRPITSVTIDPVWNVANRKIDEFYPDVTEVRADKADSRVPEMTLTTTDYNTDWENCAIAAGGQPRVIVTGKDNFCGAITNEFEILSKVEKEDNGGLYYANELKKDGAGVVPVVLATVEAGHDEYVVSNFVKGATQYRVVGILPGAFTNSAPTLWNLKIAESDVALAGNIVWGLEKLRAIDFPGTTPADSPYYFHKFGDELGGAGVLVKSGDAAAPYGFETNLTLLGVADAADVFTVSNSIVRIAKTAFAGNAILKEIVLHNNIVSNGLEVGMTDYLDVSKTVFAIYEEPSPDLEAAVAAIGLSWYKDGESRWITFDVATAEAKITSANGVVRYYQNITNAVADARNGETVVVLKDIERDEAHTGLEMIRKRVLLNAQGHSILKQLPIDGKEGGSFGLLAGTFDWNYEKPVNYLVSGVYADPTLAWNADGTWTIINRGDAVARIGEKYFSDIHAALSLAQPDDTIVLLNDISETVVLDDAAILKKLVFQGEAHLKGDPTLKAERHDEFYEIKPGENGGIRLVHKDMPTAKLTFVIEGAGRAYVDGVDARHVKDGLGTVEDYSEIAQGKVVELKGVAETNGGDAFWRFEDADGNRLYVNGTTDPYAQGTETIRFMMPYADTTLRLVFKPKAEVESGRLDVETEPVSAWLTAQVTMDSRTIAAPQFFQFMTKNGDHVLTATNKGDYAFCCWVTNGVVASTDARWESALTGGKDWLLTARYIAKNFGATVETNLVEKTYDGVGTNIVVRLANAPSDMPLQVEYLPDGASVWTTANPAYTNAGTYAVGWRVRYGGRFADSPVVTVFEGTATVRINKKNLEDEDVSISVAADNIVETGSKIKPGVVITYNDMTLVEGFDYEVEYDDNTEGGEAFAYIYAKDPGNYCVTNEFDCIVRTFDILDIYEKDNVTYYLRKRDGANIAAVARVDAGVTIGADGVYKMPNTVRKGTTVYTVVDIVPGAFTNIADRLIELNLKDCDKVNIWGNAIWGLEKLERIDFPGKTWTDSPYYYSKLGEFYNGAGVLVKNLAETNSLGQYDWENNLQVKLLGVADAGDVFEVSNNVIQIAETAFAGNEILRKIVLHNGIEEIEQGFTGYLDMEHVVFEMAEEPSDAIKAIFALEGEDGIEWVKKSDGTGWTTFAWANAEAKIVTPAGEPTYYNSFVDAVNRARDGETVIVLKDIVGHDHDITIAGKKVIIDAEGFRILNVAITAGADNLRIAGGTFDWDYAKYLVATERHPAPVMEKWFDETKTATTCGGWMWTVVDTPTVVVKVDEQGQSYRSIKDAVKGAAVGQTVTVVAATVTEDPVFDKSLKFVFKKEATWNGTLVAKGAGTVVSVSGFRANTPGIRTFGVAEGGAVTFDYSPAQHAVKDEGYAIFRADAKTWILLLASNKTARDTNDANELFYDVNTAARFAKDVTVTKDVTPAQDIVAEQDFTIRTAGKVVYAGSINPNGHKVTTALGSVFKQNLIDAFDWSNGLTLAYNRAGSPEGTYTVVGAADIVAQFVWEDGKKTVRFETPESAVAAIATFKPFMDFQIGVNDTALTYDFVGNRKKDGTGATFENLVSVATTTDVTNTIQNAVLSGRAAVTGATGTVVFDLGVRMTNVKTAFKEGGVKLIIRKGAYVNDPQVSPTEYLEKGYAAVRRSQPGHELDGYYVVYANSECAVTVTKEDGHNIHYKTLQDAFDLEAGGTIRLYNNGTVDATVPAGKTFTLTSDANGAGADKPAASITGGKIVVKGELTVDNIYVVRTAVSVEDANAKLTLKNAEFSRSPIAGKAGTVTIGDGVKLFDVQDGSGAIAMATNTRLFIDTTTTEIFGSYDAEGNPKNVVLADASILVLKKSGFHGTVGLWMADFADSDAFDGRAFGKTADGVTYPDGDLSCEEIRFMNDRDATMTTGKGKGIADKLGDGYTRYVDGFAKVETEGKKLLLRTGNKLVWLGVPAAPVDDELVVVGRTSRSLTIAPKLDDAYGRDYAVVAEGVATTNWVSMTAESLAWNGNMATYTFEGLEKNTAYALLTRRSISAENTVSDIVWLGGDFAWTGKYDALEIAKMFYDDVDWLTEEETLSERAGNEDFVVVETVGNNGDGYVVTLKRDLNRGAVIKDDAGKLLLKMNGNWLNAKVAPTQNGIRFEPATDYNKILATDLTVENDTLAKPGRIVGAAGAAGTDEPMSADGSDGEAGIWNQSANKVSVTLKGGVEVYGGKGGDGANRTQGKGGAGGNGGDAIVGTISLDLDGAKLYGGAGGNGGDSTYARGGAGGAGGNGVGQLVTGSITSGEIYGGAGGNGGGSGIQQAGVGGKGGDSLVRIGAMIPQGGDFTDDIVLKPGKGGEGSTRGEDGTGGRAEAPAAAKDLYVGGDFVTLEVESGCEYLVYKTADGEPSIEKQTWVEATDKTLFVEKDTLGADIVKGAEYTVWARKPAGVNAFVSFYASSTFTTLNYDRTDLAAFFDNSVNVTVDNEGHYVVTMTRDIDVGVRLPDDLGTFTLDMNNWTIKGPDAAALGEAGKDAVSFYKNANGDVDPKHTTKILVKGNGENAIVGGNGKDAFDPLSDADGDKGGNGGYGFGIDKSEGTPAQVVVTLTDGIVRGGNGGKGGSTVDGVAGDGGNGGDAFDKDGVAFYYEGGQLFGGEGGKGGDAVGGTAGDGGNGGDVCAVLVKDGEAYKYVHVGEGGAGGLGGKASDRTKWGANGTGGEGLIPGGMPRAYVARVDGVGCDPNGDFYTSFDEAVAYAVNGGTLTIVRNTVFDGAAEVTVTASDLTIKTAKDVTFTWNGEILVASGVSGLKFAEGFTADPASTGTLTVEDWAKATVEGGFVPNLYVCCGGFVQTPGGTVGDVTVEAAGSFEVPGDSTAVIGAIHDENGDYAVAGDFLSATGVFLRGGEYMEDPSAYVVDPYEAVVYGNNWKIQPDPRYTAMVVAGGKAWAVETIDQAFTEVSKATGEIKVYLLKDSEATIPLTDQDATDVIFYGDGHAITDKRQEKACEDALFNLNGRAFFENVVFKGDGQRGRFLRLFESDQVQFYGCTITGYACENIDGKVELISAEAAGQMTSLELFDTAITNNEVSCAISTCDRTAGTFTYPLILGGAVTITESGLGVVSDGPGQIVMAHDLTGGWIDIVYAGRERARFATAASDMLTGAKCFRFSDKKTCGAIDVATDIVTGLPLYFVRWMTDERQYAAKIVDKNGQSGDNDLYETVEAAFAKVGDGDTVVLMNDATIEKSTVVRLGKASELFTLDLNGKTLTNDGNKLKFGTGRVRIVNGAMAATTKYAVYAYGAAVTLADGVAITNGAYVAKGSLVVPQGEDVKVAGAVQALNTGSITLSGGVYTLDPSAYLASGKTAKKRNVDPNVDAYVWEVVDAPVVTGFANGYTFSTKPDGEGKISLDFTHSDAVGVLRTDAKVTFVGNVTNDLTVATPKGWIAHVAYDKASGVTGVSFEMDEAVLKPEMGSDDPGERPLEFAPNGTTADVTMRVKNGVKGFWYRLKATSGLSVPAENWPVVTSVQATENGNLTLTVKGSPDHFFTLEVSDRK